MSGCGIVCDGRERWWDGAAEAVRAEVVAEYAERLRGASPWRRAAMQWTIEREVRRRVKGIEPSREALF